MIIFFFVVQIFMICLVYHFPGTSMERIGFIEQGANTRVLPPCNQK